MKPIKRVTAGGLAGLALAVMLLAGGTSSATPTSGASAVPKPHLSQLAVPADITLLKCTMSYDVWGDGYYHPNGNIYGTTYFWSRVQCDRDVTYLWTRGWLKKVGGGTFYGGPAASCGTNSPGLPTPGCKAVQMNGSSYCDPCNGAWNLELEYRIRPSAALLLIPGTSTGQCTRSLNGLWTCKRTIPFTWS